MQRFLVYSDVEKLKGCKVEKLEGCYPVHFSSHPVILRISPVILSSCYPVILRISPVILFVILPCYPCFPCELLHFAFPFCVFVLRFLRLLRADGSCKVVKVKGYRRSSSTGYPAIRQPGSLAVRPPDFL
jgi:hypothetical protein